MCGAVRDQHATPRKRLHDTIDIVPLEVVLWGVRLMWCVWP